MLTMRSLRLARARAFSICCLFFACGGLMGHAHATSHEAFVPTESPFYFGSLAPLDVTDLASIMPAISEDQFEAMVKAQGEGTGDDTELDEGAEAALSGYSRFLADPVAFVAEYGIGEKLDMSVYMAGLAPVARLTLDNPEQFNKALAALNEEHGLQPEIGEIEGTSFMRYKADNANQSTKTNVVIATVDNHAVFTLEYPSFESSQTLLAKALGIQAPQSSLADSKYAGELTEKWGYTDGYLMYMDFQHLVSVLTRSDTEMGKDLEAVMGTLPEDETFTQMRTEICASEMQSIADTWPRAVAGYRSWEFGKDSAKGDAHGVLEINDIAITNVLTKFRGHIPDVYRGSNSVMSVALGLDVARIGQAMGELNLLMSKVNYTCPLLLKLNSMASPQAAQMVMGMTMMSGFANGVRGIGFSLFGGDVNASGGTPAMENLDALMSVSAVNPQLLLQVAKAIPQLANINLPEDGSPIDLGPEISAQTGMSVDAKAAQKGSHILMFSGEQASGLSNEIGGGSETDNGFLYFSMNMREMMTRMASSMESFEGMSDGEDTESLQQQLESMAEFYPDGFIDYGIDFTTDGIELQSFFDFIPSSR